MNVFQRAFLYVLRKKGKSWTLFVLFMLITVFVTVSVSMHRATRDAAANVRETVGATFTLRGMPIAVGGNSSDPAVTLAPISAYDVDRIVGHPGIRAVNAQQLGTAAAGTFFFPSGMPEGTIWANSLSKQNHSFASGLLNLTQGRHIVRGDRHVALVSSALAEENALTLGSDLFFEGSETTARIIGIYESDQEFDMDTLFVDHATFWGLTQEDTETYAGSVDFFVSDPADLESILTEIQKDPSLPWDKYTLQEDTEEYEAIAGQLHAFGRLMTLLIVCGFLAALVALALILAIRTRNRIHEVGILLAIGVSKSRIIAQFLIEVMLIAGVALICSWPLSCLAAGQVEIWLRDRIGFASVDIPAWNMFVQYAAEICVAMAAVWIVTVPLFRRSPKEILSKLS